jgi:hypothetical protein
MSVVEDRLLGGWDWARGKKRCVIETLVLSGSRNFFRVYIVITVQQERQNTQQAKSASN